VCSLPSETVLIMIFPTFISPSASLLLWEPPTLKQAVANHHGPRQLQRLLGWAPRKSIKMQISDMLVSRSYAYIKTAYMEQIQ
jgi:hypothetical protein